MNAKQNFGFSALRNELKKERDKVKELSARLEELSKDDQLYALVIRNEKVKNKIISEYLKALSLRPNVALSGSNGFTALTPVNRPKNLAEAKRIADKIIKY